MMLMVGWSVSGFGLPLLSAAREPWGKVYARTYPRQAFGSRFRGLAPPRGFTSSSTSRGWNPLPRKMWVVSKSLHLGCTGRRSTKTCRSRESWRGVPVNGDRAVHVRQQTLGPRSQPWVLRGSVETHGKDQAAERHASCCGFVRALTAAFKHGQSSPSRNSSNTVFCGNKAKSART